MGVDLKTAVESGRRWRWRYATGDAWSRWYIGPSDTWFIATQALYSDFEIEPEPEKPREWTIHVIAQKLSLHPAACPPECRWDSGIRVHDADACDRLEAGKVSYTGRGYTGTA